MSLMLHACMILLLFVPNPDSSGIHEERDKLVPEMKGHDLVSTTNELLCYEHRRNTWLASHLNQCPLNLLSISHFIKLIHCWVCPKATYQWLYGVAQATTALAEYHHCFLTQHALNHLRHYTYVLWLLYCNHCNVVWKPSLHVRPIYKQEEE